MAVAWDSYHYGNYDIFCRLLRPGPELASPVLGVTSSAELEARPTIAADRQGRLWIAYGVSGPFWGRDTGFWLELKNKPQGTRLYETGSIRVRVLLPQSRKLLKPVQLTDCIILDRTLYQQVEYPQLLSDSSGRLWLAFRKRTMLDWNRRGIGRRYQWELWLSRYDAELGGWRRPQLVADSVGRLEMRPSLAAASDRLWLAWSCDHRPFNSVARPDVCNLIVGSVPVSPLAHTDLSNVTLQEINLSPAGASAEKDPTHKDEAAALRRIRSYRVKCGEREYRIVHGDLHRHTENSPDGGGDGSLLDAYRDGLDAASLEFLLGTDHDDGLREYDWWLREKSNDLFTVGQRFVGLYGYERSVPYPNGHRNVLLPRRGVRPLDIDPGEQRRPGKVKLGSSRVPYPYLRAYGGICLSHTSGTWMGTDWRDDNPELEPLAELFQGDRTNYEGIGAPWSADPDEVGTQEGGFQPLGYVNNGLAKGYKLGFQACSDHLRTHLSYSCLLVEQNTRPALMQAMHQRHTYAATDNIVLDVQAPGVERPHLIGDLFTSRSRPVIKVTVLGTDGIK